MLVLSTWQFWFWRYLCFEVRLVEQRRTMSLMTVSTNLTEALMIWICFHQSLDSGWPPSQFHFKIDFAGRGHWKPRQGLWIELYKRKKTSDLLSLWIQICCQSTSVYFSVQRIAKAKPKDEAGVLQSISIGNFSDQLATWHNLFCTILDVDPIGSCKGFRAISCRSLCRWWVLHSVLA